jgi:hypothetical protein
MVLDCDGEIGEAENPDALGYMILNRGKMRNRLSKFPGFNARIGWRVGVSVGCETADKKNLTIWALILKKSVSVCNFLLDIREFLSYTCTIVCASQFSFSYLSEDLPCCSD